MIFYSQAGAARRRCCKTKKGRECSSATNYNLAPIGLQQCQFTAGYSILMLSDRLMTLYFVYAEVAVFLSDFRIAPAVRDRLDRDERLKVLMGKSV